MDTFASSKVQMTDNLSPLLKLNNDGDDDEHEIFEVDENQENNGLMKRQRLSDCVQMAKNRNKSQQPCGCCDHTSHGATNVKTVRCIVSTATAAETTTESLPIQKNATNGTTTTTTAATTTMTAIQSLKDAHQTINTNDSMIKSNGVSCGGGGNGGGLYPIAKSRENGVSTVDHDDDSNNILAHLYDGQNSDGYFDSMVSNGDVDMKSADEKDKCISADVLLNNGIDQNGCDHVIIRGHRRARARSSDDTIQAEFYQARKQQLRLQSRNDSDDLFTNGNDNDSIQSQHCDTTAYTAHDVTTTTRGKSLSPPSKIGAASRRQTINFTRSPIQRHSLIRPFSFLRKQKLLSKAKQQARLSSLPSSPSPTAMGKTIAKVELLSSASLLKQAAPTTTTTTTTNTISDKPSDKGKKDEKANSSESEYSSLEDDDDDIQEPTDSDENDLTDTEESYLDNKALYNAYNGNVRDDMDRFSMLADSVQGRCPPKTGPIAPSLFSNCPPYITFASHEGKGPLMPIAIKKVLKWKLTTITPIVIRKVLLNSGFRLLKQTNDWVGQWGKHMKSPCFRTLRTYQKMNHIPGTFQIGRKDKIWRNLQSQMSRNGKKEFSLMPLTYILPQDTKRLKRLWTLFDQRNTKWIIKPPASARGTGIKVVSRWAQIPKRRPMIVQKYIDRPLLINGSKFDLRLYVLVTSLNPLRAYMHTDGLARFASVKYSNDIDTLSDRYMHLTNYSINKLSSNYTKNEDHESCSGHKWTLKTLWKYFSAQGINTDGLWAALRNLVLRTILSGEHVINQMAKANVGSKYNTFELFGIDVILDSDLKPWLLEVNISPSLHSSSPLDLFVKGPLVTALLNTVRFNVPPRFNVSQQTDLMIELGLQGHNLCYDRRLHVVNLSKGERLKHDEFTSQEMSDRDQYLESILHNLTPDDIRCLIATEDELARCAPLERICPTPNSHRYIKFTEKPRYYNRLLDAWEHRYSNKREEGIKLLQRHCENQTHLVVPVPVSKLNGNGNKKTVVVVEKEAKNPPDHPNSENEIDEVFDASIRAVPQKRREYKTVDTVAATPAAKIIDECKSPLPMPPDDQLNDAAINDQHDILVSSIA